MKVTSILVENFRGLKHLKLDLDEFTVLIGENNSGKTAVLDALRICLRDLGPRQQIVFDALDFHLPDAAADLTSADPILIEITFSEQSKGEWSDELIRRLNSDNVLQVDGDDLSHVILRVTCKYDPPSQDFAQEWAFLNLDRKPLNAVDQRALSGLQQEVAYFYLQALRDARQHFGESGPFWRPFLKDTQLRDDKKSELEEKIREVNELVVNSHDSFERVQRGLSRVQDVVPLAAGDVVSIEAVPGRIYDMLANARINLGTMGGAKIPVGRHGEGTQSLAVLMLFAAFLEAWPEGSPIIALEEPEAHLHPSAIRALQGLVRDFSGQKLISTHSGDLLAETEIHQIRRLARTREGIRAYRISSDSLSSEEMRKFNYHVRQTRGELLFARCWLLVEGQSESLIFPAAARAMKIDLHREGIRVVEYSQSDAGLLAKIANALGIVWYCVGDYDGGGNRNKKKKLKRCLDGAKEEDRMIYPYENIEVNLMSNGYEEVYEDLMPHQNKERIESESDQPSYWSEYAKNFPREHKTRAAAAVAIKMETQGGDQITNEIRDILDKVKSLARGS